MSTEPLKSSVPTEHIFLKDHLHLPDITYYARKKNQYFYPDDPRLDGIHIHDDYEIYIHIKGDSSFLVDNKVYPLHRGDVILTKPGDVHVFIVNSTGDTEHICLWLAPACGSRLLSFAHRQGAVPHLTFDKDIAEMLLSLLLGICDKQDICDELGKISAILQIATILEKRALTNPTGPQLLPDDVQQIIDYIDSEFRHIENVKSIAKRFNISTATLNRRFRQFIRLAPSELLKAKRLSYAKKLLDDGATVTESGMRAGFSDCSYFISVFKKKFGQTPLQYKQKLR